MNNQFIITCLFLALSFCSCKREIVNDPTPEKQPPSRGAGIYAGMVEPDMILQEFNPPLEAPVIWDAQNLYGFASISLDIDQDGENDLILSVNRLNYDSLHLVTNYYPDPVPGWRLSRTGEWETSYVEIYYPLGHGFTGSAYRVNAFKYGQEISSPYLLWSSNYWTMYRSNPFSSFSPSGGPWLRAPKIAYLGLKRVSGGLWNHRYAWIEIDRSDPNNTKITRIAMEGT